MSFQFTRSNLDHFLYLFAKEYKKLNRHNPNCEIIIVGGASMLLNYNFRDSTMDIDSLLKANSTAKDVIQKISDEQNLPLDWLNQDFKRTESYSPKLVQYSKFYKTFCGCLSVRLVSSEFLLAMKLKAYRSYKHDKSDIIGIIKEHEEMEKPLNIENISKAYIELYNEKLPENLKDELNSIFQSNDLEELFYNAKELEEKNHLILKNAEIKYGNVINEDNVDDFIKNCQSLTEQIEDAKSRAQNQTQVNMKQSGNLDY